MDGGHERSANPSQKVALNETADEKRTVSPTSPHLSSANEVNPQSNNTMDRPISGKVSNGSNGLQDKAKDIAMNQPTGSSRRYQPLVQDAAKQDRSKNSTTLCVESSIPLLEGNKRLMIGATAAPVTQAASQANHPSAAQPRRPSGLEFIAMAASYVEHQSSSDSLQQNIAACGLGARDTKPASYPTKKNDQKGISADSAVVNGVLQHRSLAYANGNAARDVQPHYAPPTSGSKNSTTKAAPSAGTDAASKASNKRGKKKVRKWTRPADKPKRPLSAYNIFFRTERERMIKDKGPKKGNASASSRGIGFGGMAKAVADKWNSLGETERNPFEKLAEAEKRVYFISLEKWKRDQLLKKKQAGETDQSLNGESSSKQSNPPAGQNLQHS